MSTAEYPFSPERGTDIDPSYQTMTAAILERVTRELGISVNWLVFQRSVLGEMPQISQTEEDVKEAIRAKIFGSETEAVWNAVLRIDQRFPFLGNRELMTVALARAAHIDDVFHDIHLAFLDQYDHEKMSNQTRLTTFQYLDSKQSNLFSQHIEKLYGKEVIAISLAPEQKKWRLLIKDEKGDENELIIHSAQLNDEISMQIFRQPELQTVLTFFMQHVMQEQLHYNIRLARMLFLSQRAPEKIQEAEEASREIFDYWFLLRLMSCIDPNESLHIHNVSLHGDQFVFHKRDETTVQVFRTGENGTTPIAYLLIKNRKLYYRLRDCDGKFEDVRCGPLFIPSHAAQLAGLDQVLSCSMLPAHTVRDCIDYWDVLTLEDILGELSDARRLQTGTNDATTLTYSVDPNLVTQLWARDLSSLKN